MSSSLSWMSSSECTTTWSTRIKVPQKSYFCHLLVAWDVLVEVVPHFSFLVRPLTPHSPGLGVVSFHHLLLQQDHPLLCVEILSPEDIPLHSNCKDCTIKWFSGTNREDLTSVAAWSLPDTWCLNLLYWFLLIFSQDLTIHVFIVFINLKTWNSYIWLFKAPRFLIFLCCFCKTMITTRCAWKWLLRCERQTQTHQADHMHARFTMTKTNGGSQAKNVVDLYNKAIWPWKDHDNNKMKKSTCRRWSKSKDHLHNCKCLPFWWCLAIL